jgi:hypothetical protein
MSHTGETIEGTPAWRATQPKHLRVHQPDLAQRGQIAGPNPALVRGLPFNEALHKQSFRAAHGLCRQNRRTQFVDFASKAKITLFVSRL